jgi:hypothetical protein
MGSLWLRASMIGGCGPCPFLVIPWHLPYNWGKARKTSVRVIYLCSLPSDSYVVTHLVLRAVAFWRTRDRNMFQWRWDIVSSSTWVTLLVHSNQVPKTTKSKPATDWPRRLTYCWRIYMHLNPTYDRKSGKPHGLWWLEQSFWFAYKKKAFLSYSKIQV